ncbi:S1C family serine protease [Paenibacillus lentus]|uniref:PDZ domain-containing protein n=1 Tax=Paenibacillus lentus TaxID=1338368 RepID=A0A3Q8S9M6_9BACL|nr:trypsin-like peptidase domain-containing protein [Paenibacillus lentus]AZK45625.1 PDZ domain-containing protein [Paenibacillus lentus]
MGLFDDDFYSTKVSRRYERRMESNRGWKRRKRGSGWSTLQISIVSSVLSAIVAVLMFSFITGLPSSKASIGSGGGAIFGGDLDPFSRISTAAAKVGPTVVSILNHNELSGGDPEQAALGSGVIFKKEKGKAFIITNAHVISGASDLEILTSSGDSKEAKVVGQDAISDIAVLEVDDKGITSVITLGDSTSLRPGETVLAIGNPLGLGGTLTSGIISYTSRVIPVSINQDGNYDWEQEVIQTDAAINDGNSGGALVNLNGELIGINTMKIADMGVEGLGFAIPVSEVMKSVDDLMEFGRVARPFLGVYTLNLNNPFSEFSEEDYRELMLPKDVKEGVIVLEAHGPAKSAGLKLNDVIVQLDKQPIHSTLDLRKYLYGHKKIGEELEVSFYRDGELQRVKVKLADKPEDAELEDDIYEGEYDSDQEFRLDE